MDNLYQQGKKDEQERIIKLLETYWGEYPLQIDGIWYDTPDMEDVIALIKGETND